MAEKCLAVIAFLKSIIKTMSTNANDYGVNSALAKAYAWSGTSNGTVLVKSTAGKFRGLFISSVGTAPRLGVYDGLTGGGTIMEIFTPAAATFYQCGDNISFGTSLYVSGGTVNFSVIYY
jgi:hypothetical protein